MGFPPSFVLAAVVVMSFFAVTHSRMCFPQTVLPNLRKYRITGVAGLFLVNRDAVEGRYLDFKASIGGDDLDIVLTDFGATDEHNSTVGLVIADLNTHWTYFDNAFQVGACETQRALYMSVIIHSKGEQRLLNIGEVTEENESVNWDTFFRVDSVVTNGKTATFMINNDVISIREDPDTACVKEMAIENNTDCSPTTAKVYMKYNGKFSWGCDGKWATSDYCKVLTSFNKGVEEAGGNVCVITETLPGTTCTASMSIESVTGVFKEQFPFLAETVGASALVATYVNEYQEVGLTFPCIV